MPVFQWEQICSFSVAYVFLSAEALISCTGSTGTQVLVPSFFGYQLDIRVDSPFNEDFKNIIFFPKEGPNVRKIREVGQ